MLFFVIAYQNHMYTQTACSEDVIDALTLGKVCPLKLAWISTENLSVPKKNIFLLCEI